MRPERETMPQIAPLLSLKTSAGDFETPRFDDAITATVAERVTQLEGTVTVLTEGNFNQRSVMLSPNLIT